MKLTHIILASIIVGIFSSCETEIDITGDYERIPVVYGLLDPSVEKQIFMINRTFLANVNALEIVNNEDSMLFDNVDAAIEWYNTNGALIGSTTLAVDTIDTKAEDGIFYAPTAVVYTAESEDIWDNWPNQDDRDYTGYTYRLNIMADGQQITAETKMASTFGTGNGAIQQPALALSDIQLVSQFNQNGSTYNSNFRVVWNAGTNDVKNAVKQKMDVRFKYREVYTDGSFEDKSVVFPFHVEDVNFEGEEIEEARNGQIFYERIANAINAQETAPNLRYREIGNFDFELSVAGDDFTTYLNIGESDVSAVGQSRPTFSNINDGDAIGIFSSRDIYIREKALYTNGNESDLREMVQGQFTGELCFCDATGISIDFSCDDEDNWCQ